MTGPAAFHLTCRARVANVLDGNTLDIESTTGSRILLRRCRLLGVDAPSLDDPDPAVRAVARLAKDFVETLTRTGEVVVTILAANRREGAPWRAVVHWRDAAGDWNNLNEDLIENGLAVASEAGPSTGGGWR